jgi:hypothetical protein
MHQLETTLCSVQAVLTELAVAAALAVLAAVLAKRGTQQWWLRAH